MSTLNLDELERLLAEAKQDRDNKIMQSFSLYGTKAEIVLSDAAVRALPALIAAARERDALKADNERLRAALKAAPHVEVYDHTIRYDFQWPQYAKWYTETRRTALEEQKP